MSELITKTKLLAFNKWSFGLATQNILLIYKFNIKNHSLIYLPLNFINYKYILNVYIYMYYLIIFLNTQTKLYSKSYKIIYLILSQPHKQLFLYFIFPNYARCWSIGSILKILNRYTKTLKKKPKGVEFALKYLQFMLPNIFKYLKLKNYELRILTYISSINTLLNTMHITKYLKFFKSIYSISYIRLGTRYIGLKKIRAIKRHTRKRLIKKSESIKFNN